MARVRFNASGTIFEADLKYFEKKPAHRLSSLVLESRDHAADDAIIVERPAESFAAIVAYYQTGELHIPAGVCPGAFRGELDYWGIGADQLSDCCVFRYFAFFSEQAALKKFCTTVLRDKTAPGKGTPGAPTGPKTPIRKFRERLWNIVDNNESSIWATIYFCGIFVLVLVSILTLAYGTEPMFQRKLTKCELLEYFEHSDNSNLEKLRKYLKNPDCGSQWDKEEIPDSLEYDYIYFYSYDNETWFYMYTDTENTTEINTLSTTTTPSPSTANPSAVTATTDEKSDPKQRKKPQKKTPKKEKIHIPVFMIQNRVIDMLEIITLACFTVDFSLRIFSCPSIPRYFLSVINIVDVIALLGTYVHLIIINVEREQRYLDNWLDITLYFQILRTFRLFRVVKNFRVAKVMAYSVTQSLRDLLVLILFLMIAVFSFASVIYLAEDRADFASIPMGWWWALVTLTTVGYGDIYPKTAIGRLIGSACAISGVILIALTLPIFVNNFLTLYSYAEVDKILQKTTKPGENFGSKIKLDNDCGGEEVCEAMISKTAELDPTEHTLS